ncbi:MAG TPA: SEC-C metal-binding domain-containing protein [Phycisphaerae bacterium]|nr:SEC-C metal-binding domain-containing protein [Phycisphaerae bacterium]
MFDKFAKRYQRKQEEKKLRDAAVVSDDDVPIPDMPVEQAKAEHVIGRNDPCPCGSGKKYKKCCFLKDGKKA